MSIEPAGTRSRVLQFVVGLLVAGCLVAAAILMAVYTRPDRPVVGLPEARWQLLAAAGVLLAVAAIWPLKWLTRELSIPVGENAPRASWPQRLLFGLALLLLVAAFGVLGQFDGLLRGLHGPGDTSAGVNAAISAFTPPADRKKRFGDAVGAWSKFVRPRAEGVDLCAQGQTTGGPADAPAAPPFPKDCNAPITVLTWQLGIDTAVLVPAYAVLLGLLLVWGRRLVCQRTANIAGTAGPQAVPRIARFAKLMAWLLLLAVVADWVENGLTTLLATDAWVNYNPARSGDYGSLGLLASTIWSWLLSLAVWFKWAGLLVVAGYLLGMAILLAEHGDFADRRWGRVRGVAQTLVAVRVQLLVVGLFAGLLLLHEQVPDVIRRWTDEGSRAVGARGVLIALLLAMTVWLSGLWMVKNASPGTPTSFHLTAVVLAPVSVVLAAVVAPWLLGWAPDKALAVPIALVAVIGLLSLLLPRNTDIRTPSRRIRVSRVESLQYVIAQRLKEGLGRKPTQAERERYWNEVRAANPGIVEGDELRLRPRKRTLVLPDVSVLASPGLAREVMPRLLASAVVAILGLAVLRASAGLTLFNQLLGLDRGRFLSLALIGLGLLLLAGVGYWLFGGRVGIALAGALRLHAPTAPVARRPWLPIVLLSVCLLAWWGVIWWMAKSDFYGGAQWLGAIGVVGAGLLLFTVTVCSIVALPDRLSAGPAPLFRVLGLRRTPMLSLLAIWVVAVSVLPLDEQLHDVRPEVSRPGNTGTTGITLNDAFDQWRARNCIAVGTRVTGQEKPVVPLILVASSGGGVRAAAWTSQVLDRVLGVGPASGGTAERCTPGQPKVDTTPRVNWVFAASGVSGGSLGLAAYAARLAEDDVPQDAQPLQANLAGVHAAEGTRPARWWRERLDEDSLAASLSWMLFAETPWSWLRFHAERDRAEVLEATWERAWRQHGVAAGKGLDQGFFSLQQQQAPKPRVPLLLFNGTSVESGCRFNASMLQASGRQRDEPSAGCLSPRGLQASPDAVLAATVDLADFVCPYQQPRLSTAVLLSARFPVISPSGHLERPACAGDGPPPRPETFVVDGGYLENSGADTAIDLWSALAPLIDENNQDPAAPASIVPLFIQIDNGYAEPAGPGAVPRKPQFVTPLLAVNATRDGRQADARQGAQVLFAKPFLVDGRPVRFGGEANRYVRFSLLAHPGARAPTGWTLSDTSFDDLEQQFDRSNPNGDAETPLARVQTWFKEAQLG
jgi:hypothetical protein